MRYLFTLALLLTTSLIQANDLENLKMGIQQSRSLSANFVQEVIDQNGKKTQTATGKVLIQRPGKFYWHYDHPYPSDIIGNGQKVWFYDPELKQVTIKNMQDALEQSPAALLSGNNHFETYYTIKPIGNNHCLEATPKSKDSHFNLIRIGLKGTQIQNIELLDQLGQTTKITFSHIVLNPVIKNNVFNFIPPKGVDVIND